MEARLETGQAGTARQDSPQLPDDLTARALRSHRKVALQFSGGKDSLACLYLLKPYWDLITVCWMNMGNCFPEVIEQMEGIRSMVPHFLEVKSDQPSQIGRKGYPVDVLPIWSEGLGKASKPSAGPAFQSALQCCAENFWLPFHDQMMRLGVTLIIRGQRAQEVRRAPIKNGHVELGIAVWFPIESWSTQDVVDYLRSQNVAIPKYYEIADKSLDCMNCTAYLDESAGRMRYVRAKHPELWAELAERLKLIRAAIQQESAHLDAALTPMETQ